VVQFTITPATGSSGYLKVSVLDASNNVLSSNTKSYSSTTSLVLSANTSAGIAYLIIEPFDAYNYMSGDYIVTPAIGSGHTGNRTEQFHRTANALALNGIDIKGQLSSGTDKDYFSFTSPGGVVQFTITPATGSSGYLKVSVLDASNNVLSSNTKSYSSTTSLVLSANTSAGIAYLIIEPFDAYNYMSGDYIVTPAIGSDTRETEPNNSTGTANALALTASISKASCRAAR